MMGKKIRIAPWQGLERFARRCRPEPEADTLPAGVLVVIAYAAGIVTGVALAAGWLPH